MRYCLFSPSYNGYERRLRKSNVSTEASPGAVGNARATTDWKVIVAVTNVKSERITHCAPGLAGPRVRAFFASLGSEEAVGLRLHARVRIPGLGIEVPVERDVLVRMHRYSDNDHLVEVEWDPRSKLLPRFNGIINITPEGNAACRLILTGVYDPPMGRFGTLVDRFIGVRVAQTTAAELLQHIGRSMEHPSTG